MRIPRWMIGEFLCSTTLRRIRRRFSIDTAKALARTTAETVKKRSEAAHGHAESQDGLSSLEERIARARQSLYSSGKRSSQAAKVRGEMQNSATRLGKRIPESRHPTDVAERAAKVAGELRGQG